MNCLPCFQKDDDEEEGSDNQPAPTNAESQAALDAAKEAAGSSNAQTFTFRELAMATRNFRQECLLGEGGFGRVFRGKLQASGQVVAVKQLDRNGMQGNKEFLVEILMLSLLQHPNLVSLIGYCADGDQRLLVYEYLEMGNMEKHLFGDDPDKKPMDWYTRMKIAAGVAQGLEYLHHKANPPIVYRDLKPSNILLDENYEPKLSDFGLAKLGAGGGKMHPTSRVMGTYGYSAPEYSSSGELTLKSDIYSFGVVLLELLTGRRVIDTTRPNDEQNLVTWAQPIFRDTKRFPELADPRLNKEFPLTSLNQAVGICAMCLQEEPQVRPLISDVVAALSFLSMPQPSSTHAAAQSGQKDASPHACRPPAEQKMHYENDINQDRPSESAKDSSNHDSESENEESNGESLSEQQNEGSSHISTGENYETTETGGSSVVEESEHLSGRHSAEFSEDESTYSISDSEIDSDHFGDAETSELEFPGRPSNPSVVSLSLGPGDSSAKSDAGNLSSKDGSSQRSSPTKRTSSRRKKLVVTFKEPSKSKIRSQSKKDVQEGNNSEKLQATTDARQQSSSSCSSSESSSSESEDEKGSLRHEDAGSDVQVDEPSSPDMKAHVRHDSEEHRVFDAKHKSAPKLRHLQTR